MKLLSLIILAFSVSAFAQRTETINVPTGEMETTLSRSAAETRKQTALFSWIDQVTITENYCANWRLDQRPIFCRFGGRRGGRRGGLRICGWRTIRVCTRTETRTYTRDVTRRYNVKLKFRKSARTGFRGVETYNVKFDKASRCALVTAANTRAETRDIRNRSCRKAIIK